MIKLWVLIKGYLALLSLPSNHITSTGSRRVINVHPLDHSADGQTAVGHTLERTFLKFLVDNWCRFTAREVLSNIGSGGLVIDDEQEVTNTESPVDRGSLSHT